MPFASDGVTWLPQSTEDFYAEIVIYLRRIADALEAIHNEM